jgi:phospholipid/cholesterol/gamma-HCH transport system ATP-binding protein
MGIVFEGVKKRFGDKVILDGVDIDVRDGECFFVIGTSGVGKSVLIKHVVGLLKPDAGRILLDGVDVAQLDEEGFMPIRKRCAMVFQSSTLFDSMTCLDNVALPLRKHRGMNDHAARSEARRLLEKVRMESFADSNPSVLGDGLRKRVAIARALTLEPKYVLFDEPTTSLDPVSARRVDELIRRLSDELGVTSIVVSHDLESIFSIADRVAMLYQGRVRILGTQEELRASTDPVVHQFIRGEPDGPMVI